MTEFKIGDMVELEVDMENSKQKFQKGRVGIIVGIGTKGIEIKFSEGNLITGFSYLKKIGKFRPDLPNREEYIKRLYGEEVNFRPLKEIKPEYYNTVVLGERPQTNTDKIFEMLGVKVNEEFYLRLASHHTIHNTDAFYFDERLKLCCKNPNLIYDVYLGDILNGKYTIIKRLLTDEEKTVLNLFEFKTLKKFNNSLIIDNINLINLISCKHKFSGLTIGVEYTPQELGLCSK